MTEYSGFNKLHKKGVIPMHRESRSDRIPKAKNKNKSKKESEVHFYG